MPTIKKRRAARRARQNIRRRKNKPVTRRETGPGQSQDTPRVIANSVFALTVKPKTWAMLADEMPDKEYDQESFNSYKDLVRCYNHGADLVGAEHIPYDQSLSTSALAVAELVELFKTNICPKGFEVNIDEHYDNKRKRAAWHFTMYKECKFPLHYWHFFDIKKLVKDLYRKDRRLHDFFIVFLRTFAGFSGIHVWFDPIFINSMWELKEYRQDLANTINMAPEEVYERNNLTKKQMIKRLKNIDACLEVYETGEAKRYEELIMKVKPVKPKVLLRQLKKFPAQSKVVQFMKDALDLLADETVATSDFNYNPDGEANEEGLTFSQQTCIVWDWHDHVSAMFSNAIQSVAQGYGVHTPTLAARILPHGAGGLSIPRLIKGLGFPMKISSLQATFQKITSKYTNYDKQRDLL